MADLEDLGFIEKTHTSSGRVPSQKGYRYYVDFIVNQEPIETTPEVGIFKQLLEKKQFERETTIKEAVKLLSSLTIIHRSYSVHHVIIVELKKFNLFRFQIVKRYLS